MGSSWATVMMSGLWTEATMKMIRLWVATTAGGICADVQGTVDLESLCAQTGDGGEGCARDMDEIDHM